MADINVTQEIIDVNVTEEVITIAAANGAYPLAYPVYSVFGRTGAVVATEGDYSLTQLSDVTLTSPANGQVLKYNGTIWTNSTDIDTGITTLNTLTALSQNFATGTSGNDFNISSASSTHTFNLPTASATNRGLLSSADWTTFNNKQNALTNPITGTGTTNALPKFTGSTAIGNSNITDTGSLITLGSDTTISSGGLGIGTTSLTGYNLRVSKNISGTGSSFGVIVDGAIQSDVTNAVLFRTTPSTAASAFTLSSLQHFTAGTTTIGSGSTVTNQYGFLVIATAIGATNNYAFSGQLAAATNTWNLYNSGTAPNYMNGSLSIGTTSSTGYRLIVGGAITGSTTSYGVYSFGTIQSDVTSAAYMYRAAPSTAAASFTLTNLFNYHSSAGTVGAGATITNHFGYYADALSIGTNNYGFFGAVAAGTGRWNLFMNGTADNYLSGNLGIGGSQNNVSAGSILTSTLTNGGSGYVDGVYTDVAVTAISTNGTYALYTITVVSGIVTDATLTWGGQTYKVGDTITVSNTLLGGTGSGLIITVSTVDSSILKLSSGTTTGSDLSLYRSSTSILVTNPIGSIKWEGNDASTKSSGVYAKLSAFAAGSSGGAYLSFFTSTGSGGALNEAVRIGSNGSVGIGGAYSLTQYTLRVEKNITGSTIGYGIASVGVSQSDVTGQSHYYMTSASTAATSYTLASLFHYRAIQGTFGAGSTVTSQIGFNVDNTLIGATNNYGFFGNIPSGTNRWNLYMNGTAENYLAGDTGIGVSANLIASGPILTSTLINGGSGYVDGTYTDVAVTTISAVGLYALYTIVVSGGIVTTATLTWGGIGYKIGNTISVSNTLLGGTGSGLIITVASVDSSQLTIASTTGADITLLRNDTTLNPNDNVGTIKWISNDSTTKASGIVAEISAMGESTNGGAYLSFYTRAGVAGSSLLESMRVAGNGGVGIGATSLTGYSLRISKLITGATTAYAIRQDGSVQSDVTVSASNFASFTNTAASAFTLGSYTHFSAQQGTIGAGSSITTQYGFLVNSNLTGATNNFAFYGNIPLQANAWNLYMSGTANNYMAGSLGIGSVNLTSYTLKVSKNITGGTIARGIASDGAIQSDVTATAFMFISNPITQATTFTLNNLVHYHANLTSIGAGNTINNQYGFFAENTLIGATNNYGFYGNIASGTNRWNLYMAGTAQNYLAGNTGIGVVASTTAELSIGAGTTAQAQINLAASTAPTSPVNGDIWFDGTNLKIRVGGVTKTVTIV